MFTSEDKRKMRVGREEKYIKNNLSIIRDTSYGRIKIFIETIIILLNTDHLILSASYRGRYPTLGHPLP